MNNLFGKLVLILTLIPLGLSAADAVPPQNSPDQSLKSLTCRELQDLADQESLNPSQANEWWQCVSGLLDPDDVPTPGGLMAIVPAPEIGDPDGMFPLFDFEGAV